MNHNSMGGLENSSSSPTSPVHIEEDESGDESPSATRGSRSTSTKNKADKSSSSSSKKEGGGRRRRKKQQLDPKALAEKRQRHNEVEIRRRRKITERFGMLKELTKCEVSHRGAILGAAIERLERLESVIAMYKQGKSVDDSLLAELSVEGAMVPFVPDSKKLTYASLFTSSGVPMMLNTINGQIVDCNEAFCVMMRAPRAKLLESGMGLFAFTHKDSLPATFDMINKLMNEEITSAEIHKSFLTQTGEVFEARATVWIVRENGAPKYVNCIVVPTTHRHGRFRGEKPKDVDLQASSDDLPQKTNNSVKRVKLVS